MRTFFVAIFLGSLFTLTAAPGGCGGGSQVSPPDKLGFGDSCLNNENGCSDELFCEVTWKRVTHGNRVTHEKEASCLMRSERGGFCQGDHMCMKEDECNMVKTICEKATQY